MAAQPEWPRVYKYVWKIGPELLCNRQIEVDHALYAGAMLVDLLTGARYQVQSIYEPRAYEIRFPSWMPDIAIQTLPHASLTEEELLVLRKTAGYVPDADCQPFGDLVFALRAPQPS